MALVRAHPQLLVETNDKKSIGYEADGRKVALAKRPGGSKAEWTAVASGTDAIKYVVQTGDLNVAGTWELQAYIEMPGWKGRGEWSPLKVLP